MSKDKDQMFAAWAAGAEWQIRGEGYRAQVAASTAAVREAYEQFGEGSKELALAILYGNKVLDGAEAHLATAPEVLGDLIIADTDWDEVPE